MARMVESAVALLRLINIMQSEMRRASVSAESLPLKAIQSLPNMRCAMW